MRTGAVMKAHISTRYNYIPNDDDIRNSRYFSWYTIAHRVPLKGTGAGIVSKVEGGILFFFSFNCETRMLAHTMSRHDFAITLVTPANTSRLFDRERKTPIYDTRPTFTRLAGDFSSFPLVPGSIGLWPNVSAQTRNEMAVARLHLLRPPSVRYG